MRKCNLNTQFYLLCAAQNHSWLIALNLYVFNIINALNWQPYYICNLKLTFSLIPGSSQWCLERPPSSSWCAWVSWWSWWSLACSESAPSIDAVKVPRPDARRAAANGTTLLSPSLSTLWRYETIKPTACKYHRCLLILTLHSQPPPPRRSPTSLAWASLPTRRGKARKTRKWWSRQTTPAMISESSSRRRGGTAMPVATEPRGGCQRTTHSSATNTHIIHIHTHSHTAINSNTLNISDYWHK